MRGGRWGAWLAVAAMSVAMGATAAAQTPKVGVAVYGLENEFMEIWTKGLESHPAIASGDVAMTLYDAEYDSQKQHAQFQIMVDEGYDAIIVVPVDVDVNSNSVALALRAGIPVVASNTRVDGEVTAFVGSDDVAAGRMEAQHVIDQLNGEGGVVILEGPQGSSAQVDRLAGNKAALGDASGVSVLEQAYADWSRDTAFTLMSGWLETHGDAIKGVIGQNDEMALGAIDAIEAAGKTTDDIVVVGIDGITDAIIAVTEGRMLSFLQDGRAQAQGALDVALRAAIGPAYAPRSDIWAQYPDLTWTDGEATTYSVPWTPITEENGFELLDLRL